MKDLFADLIQTINKRIPSNEIIFESGNPAIDILYLDQGLIKLERITEEHV